ncbi:hypothetical protein QQF64_032549 [Cirrhinus molitorella]|uniref:Uncharacterized protein n=1 Tax=Cirrhinus molitorella TaxID=172907 RepID=A0ABR3N018_9TELE
MLQSIGSRWAQNCCRITRVTTPHRDSFSRAGPKQTPAQDPSIPHQLQQMPGDLWMFHRKGCRAFGGCL